MRIATVKNNHKVPTKQWKKWRVSAQGAFNSLYEKMTHNPRNFHHAAAMTVPPRHFKATAWNASWEAADLVNAALKKAIHNGL